MYQQRPRQLKHVEVLLSTVTYVQADNTVQNKSTEVDSTQNPMKKTHHELLRQTPSKSRRVTHF